MLPALTLSLLSGVVVAAEPVHEELLREITADNGVGVDRAPAPNLHLDIVSANAWGLPAPLAPRRHARMRQLAQWTHGIDADVVGLQEMWSGAVPLTPLSLLRTEDGWDDGLALHSRHPVEHLEALPFRRARSWDALKTKGVLRGRVVRPDGPPVWVYVTHLQAGHGAANARVREAQVAELLGWLAEHDEPALVVGDFNVDWQDPEDRPLITTLAEAGLVDVAQALRREQATYPADGHRYDRIYLRSAGGWTLEPVTVEVIDFDDHPHTATPAAFSDHQPLRAKVRIHPTPQ